MSDITVCSGHGCNLKNTCWRAIAPRDPRNQSHFVTPPYNYDLVEDIIGVTSRFRDCDYYWEYDAKEEMKNDE